ncbi:amidohydrolase family protein (plasmid) [Halorarum halophilum]|uniref:Amidohydrolase family protein n=1 Tax=Halorarum halophilum TaxID=2743090 RepID=A0A7D5KIC4_9EURY|nr:amidohydrolase family protein [Halobaculum halophilum]QLG29896.1 amidohydrolase family protein [Halobaculum halophilum]
MVDCDVHQDWATDAEFTKYLPKHYWDRGVTTPGQPGWNNPVAESGISRNDSLPEDGGPAGSDRDLLGEHLFEDFGVNYAVLTGPGANNAFGWHPNLHYGTAGVEAYNDWLIEEWLDRDERFLGSLSVVPADPEHAVEEIERVGDHDQMVQVILPGSYENPYGHKRYWPIYEAAENAGLPIATHVSSSSRGTSWAPATGAGIPLSYIEKHAVVPMPLVGNLASVVLEGVFVEFPDLQWLFVEGRFTWLPDMMWQLDKNWKGLGNQVPWLERQPSEYIRENCWFSTQPVPEPENPEHLTQMLDMVHAEETLVYASDYPHWDNDNPKAMLNGVDEDVRRKIFGENAREIYGL